MIDDSGIRRVLQVHTRYRQAGGEDRAVEAERALLTAAGIQVEQVIFDNADLRESTSLVGDLRLAIEAVWSRAAARRVGGAIGGHRPDVVHIHNTFAAASPSVVWAARRLGIPVVQTLHNYRLVCPAATLFRDAKPCHDCLRVPFPAPAVVHACVRGSRSQSLVAATAGGLHRWLGTFARGVDAHIVLTAFQRDLLARNGLPRGRMHVVPNFVDLGVLEPAAGPRSGLLYAGRLVIEKGVELLLAAAALVPGQVEIAGDGPLAPLVKRAASDGIVNYLGPLSPADLAGRMRRAIAVVVPSLWYEGFPMVVLEAYAAATPVIATRIGSLAEVVEDGTTGRLVPPQDPRALAAVLEQAASNRAEMMRMGVAARRRCEDRYSGSRHLDDLTAVYRASATGPTEGPPVSFG